MGRVVAVALLCLALVVASTSLCAAGYAKTVTVSAIGGDFTTVSAAVNSITDAGATNRYLVQVYPGTYEGQVVCKPYVDVVGASRKSVVIQDEGTWPSVVMVLAPHIFVGNMTIKATAPGGSVFWANDCGNTIVDNCALEGDAGIGYLNGFGSPETPDREANIDQWITLKNCSVKGTTGLVHMSDDSAAENCVFTMINANNLPGGGAIEFGGNATMRDCLFNVTLTGVLSGEFSLFQHTDYAYPTRLERCSINLRVLNPSSTGMVMGLKNGEWNDVISGPVDVNQCAFQIVNNGTGATYDLVNCFNQEGWEWSGVYVCATKYDHSFGFVFPKSMGDISVRNIEVTGNLTVSGNTTVVLPAKDRTRLLPVVIMGTIDTPKMVFGNAYASPVIGYSFPDAVTVTKLVATATVPGGLWPDSAGQIMLMKNGQQVGGAVDMYNDTANPKFMQFELQFDEPFSTSDKMGILLEPFYSYSDVSIMLEYTVD